MGEDATASAPWAPVLLYHRVVERLPPSDPFGNCITAVDFDRQMRWLALRGFNPLPLSRLAQVFEPSPAGRTEIRQRPVAITFDDGYRDNFSNALPILRRHGFTATVFLVSGAVGSKNNFDPAAGHEAEMLRLDEIRAMLAEGIEFGSHTRSHPPSLPHLSDADLTGELELSKRDIEAMVDRPVDQFAYPHGRINGRVEAAVCRAGYKIGCAAVGTSFTRYRVNRIQPRTGSRTGLELLIGWRRLKWRVASMQGRPARADTRCA